MNEHITETLSENHPCYVLITCGKPKLNGQIDVEMTFGGDRVLAAYLLESASSIMEEV
mgnify:CR=1 FL=1